VVDRWIRLAGVVASVLAAALSVGIRDAAPRVHAGSEIGLRIAGYYANPIPPVAGRVFDVALAVVEADSGQPVVEGVITCRARLGSRSLVALSHVQGTRSHCQWQLPRSAAGATLSGSIRVRYAGWSVSRSFGFRLAPPPEQLKVFAGPNFSPPAPQAGGIFQAAVKVRLVDQRGRERELRPRVTSATCRATAGGSALTATKRKVLPEGVICGWLVPRGTAGELLVFVLTVRSEGQTASRTFRLRIR